MIVLGALLYLAATIVTTAAIAAWMENEFGDLDGMDWGVAGLTGLLWPTIWAIAAVVWPARRLRHWFSAKMEEAKSEPR